MRRLSIVVALLLASVGLSAPTATAATTWDYGASVGGSQVKAFDGTVRSDLTAQSYICCQPLPTEAHNSTAAVTLSSLARIGAVETRAAAREIEGGIEITTWARTAGVSLLGGLITADAVETRTTTVGESDGTTSATGGTKFVGLKVAGVELPAVIPPYYTVEIPGVAQLAFDWFITGTQGDTRGVIGFGLAVTLLQGSGNAAPGAQIFLNPTFVSISPKPPADLPVVGGFAFGSWVAANADQAVAVESGPTALVATPSRGSDGKTLTNSTAAVNVPGVLTTAAISSTSTSSARADGSAEVVNTNEVAQLNLLGGLVTADVIKTSASGKMAADGQYTGDTSMTLVNLRVAGQPVDVNVAPNTAINIEGVATVIVNNQWHVGKINMIRGIYIELTAAKAGLPAGATIAVATAASWIQ